jgi:hypothetical protein
MAGRIVGQSEREENHGADQASCPCGPGMVWKGVFTPFHGRVFEGGAGPPFPHGGELERGGLPPSFEGFGPVDLDPGQTPVPAI